MGGNRRRKSDYRAGPPGRSASGGCAVGGRDGQVAPPSVPVWCRGIACLIPSLRAINFVLRADFGSPTFEDSVSHCCIRWTPRRAGGCPRRLCAAGRATRSDSQAKRRAPPAPPTPKYPRYVPHAPQPPRTFLDAGGNRRRKRLPCWTLWHGVHAGLLTQGVPWSHRTPWYPAKDPLDPLQIGQVQYETLIH